jgi:hypothetical protein
MEVWLVWSERKAVRVMAGRVASFTQKRMLVAGEAAALLDPRGGRLVSGSDHAAGGEDDDGGVVVELIGVCCSQLVFDGS